jgi:hypothetical protein
MFRDLAMRSPRRGQFDDAQLLVRCPIALRTHCSTGPATCDSGVSCPSARDQWRFLVDVKLQPLRRSRGARIRRLRDGEVQAAPALQGKRVGFAPNGQHRFLRKFFRRAAPTRRTSSREAQMLKQRDSRAIPTGRDRLDRRPHAPPQPLPRRQLA